MGKVPDGTTVSDYDDLEKAKKMSLYTSCSYLMWKDVKINLYGVSMGATTVLLAAIEPDMIKLNYITADCGFTDPKRIFTDVMKKWYHLQPFPILNIANMICKHKAGFTINQFSTIEAVKVLTIPVTFIHGGADDFVLPQNSIDNYQACVSKKELILVPDAEHGVSYIKDTQKVAQALECIFENYFS